MSEVDRIIAGNLEKMTGVGEGNMQTLIFGESIGGNAGNWRGISCAAANFFYNLFGDMYFGNWQEVHKEIRGNGKILGSHPARGTYRITRTMTPGEVDGIVEIYFEDRMLKYDGARRIIKMCAAEFNKVKGFKIDKINVFG